MRLAWSAGLLPPEFMSCTCHCCASNALQTVEGCVCKVAMLCTVIVIMTRILYLLLILRYCIPSDIDFDLRTDVMLSSLLFYLCMPNEQASHLAEAHLVDLSKGISFAQD